jgi:hypothetical protein
MANHVATITKSSKLLNLPFHAQCDCGTAGTFADVESAKAYMNRHAQNVLSQSPANTFKLIDDSTKPEKMPVLPSTHVAGVGPMPAAHATQSAPSSSKPPAPPAPPNRKVETKTETKTEPKTDTVKK